MNVMATEKERKILMNKLNMIYKVVCVVAVIVLAWRHTSLIVIGCVAVGAILGCEVALNDKHEDEQSKTFR